MMNFIGQPPDRDHNAHGSNALLSVRRGCSARVTFDPTGTGLPAVTRVIYALQKAPACLLYRRLELHISGAQTK